MVGRLLALFIMMHIPAGVVIGLRVLARRVGSGAEVILLFLTFPAGLLG